MKHLFLFLLLLGSLSGCVVNHGHNLPTRAQRHHYAKVVRMHHKYQRQLERQYQRCR